MHAEDSSVRATSALFQVLFLIFALLVLAAIGYAGWAIITYWGQARL